MGCVACWASNMCQTSTLAEAMAVDVTVFESRPRGSGSIVSELLLEVAIQLLEPLVYTTTSYSGNQKSGLGTM